MQCPNCRKVENGQWLYANGKPTVPEFSMDDWTHDEDLHDLGYFETMIEDIVARMHFELRDQFEEQLQHQHQQQQINTLQQQVLDQGRMMEELFSREQIKQELVSRMEMLRSPSNNSDDNR
ncbi:hypothetical protein HS088_TW12G01087 [Tripterygium wilfordii]|uniref:Uncharacterized protein n=1 Tax=Tripterygium wilfordii TaxID=458696 RepID=A0A7J7D1C7_TRIWF|nr:hypothetical protein HS088_TW12G01087 [Tripterygium wilfordii]